MNNQKLQSEGRVERLKKGYKIARKQLQSIEIEINRSSIVLINKKGELIRVPVLHEH